MSQSKQDVTSADTDQGKTPRLASPIGARLSSIMMEFQKRQATEAAPTPILYKPKRLALKEEVVIAIMGVTGAGKSSFIKRLTGLQDVKIGNGLQSDTQDIQSFKFEHNSKIFSIVDTPGFNDTFRSDNDVLRELASWLLCSFRDGIKVNGIIYLHRISDTKMEGSALRNLRMFRKLCGDDFMKNVILGTTFWDVVSPEQGEAREKELVETEGFFKDMRDGGCEVVRMTNDREENLDLISRFVGRQAAVMKIQQELLEGKTLSQTAAASAVSQELAELQSKTQAEMADVAAQGRKQVLRSTLDSVLSRHLERKDKELVIDEIKGEQETLKLDIEEQEKKDNERFEELKKLQTEQDQMFRVLQGDLNEKLRALEATDTAS